MCFGRPFEYERYWQAISDSCLDSNLKLFPNGDLTEVVNVVSLCPVVRSNVSTFAELSTAVLMFRSSIWVSLMLVFCHVLLIECLQDPLSALDAHVGRTVFQRVFMNNLEGPIKILVTHALHFLLQVDYIYTIADGQVMERGTYVELMANHGVFSKFVKEFGSKQQQEDGTDETNDGVEVVKKEKNEKRPDTADLKEEYEKGKTIMQGEERNVGAVTRETYKEYLTAGNGYILIPALLLALLLVQGTQVMSNYWLVFWQEQQFHQPAGSYVRDRIYSFPDSRSS